MRLFLGNLEVIRENEHVPMSIENTIAISMVNDQKFNIQSSHVKTNYYYIIEKEENKDIEIFYTPL